MKITSQLKIRPNGVQIGFYQKSRIIIKEWFMTDSNELLLITIGGIAGAIVAVSNLGKAIKEHATNAYNYVKNRKMKKEKLSVIVDQFDCIQQKLDSLVAELRPNGGKSLRDLIEKINLNTTYNREYVRATLDNDIQMIYETNEVGEVVWVNNTYGRYAGKQIDDLLDNGWINSVTTEFRNTVRDEWQSAVEEHRDFNLEYDMISYDGSKMKVQSVARPIKVAGNIKGYYGVIKIVQ
jgi:PAS domain S-box-containing protein